MTLFYNTHLQIVIFLKSTWFRWKGQAVVSDPSLAFVKPQNLSIKTVTAIEMTNRNDNWVIRTLYCDACTKLTFSAVSCNTYVCVFIGGNCVGPQVGNWLPCQKSFTDCLFKAQLAWRECLRSGEASAFRFWDRRLSGVCFSSRRITEVMVVYFGMQPHTQHGSCRWTATPISLLCCCTIFSED